MNFIGYGIAVFVLLPTLAYLVVKFGAAGYFRAKRRAIQEQPTIKEHQHESKSTE